MRLCGVILLFLLTACADQDRSSGLQPGIKAEPIVAIHEKDTTAAVGLETAMSFLQQAWIGSWLSDNSVASDLARYEKILSKLDQSAGVPVLLDGESISVHQLLARSTSPELKKIAQDFQRASHC